MAKLSGGTRVSKGYYFEIGNWALQPVACDGELLPGTPEHMYVHVPLLLVFVVAPLMGAAFVMFLPCIGFCLVLQAAFHRLARIFGRSATEMAATVRPGWQPGEAHLTGRRGEGEQEGGEAPPPEDHLVDLEQEIAKRRRER